MIPPQTPSADLATPRPRLILVGGFLGAGKTTLITECVQRLTAQGLRCAIVTNDQSQGLVDSAMATLAAGETAVGEVTGACFCCQLDNLVATVRQLTESERPDILFCEPVGSCTDLRATVLLPLAEIYEMEVRLAPFTAVLDARRALALYAPPSGKRKKGFAKEVNYIFRKQIEEADVLFLNKVEVLSEEERQTLLEALQTTFSDKTLFAGSARSGEGVERWLQSWSPDETRALSPREGAEVLEIDYERYAYGEALLGWYNATLKLSANTDWSGDDWLLARANEIAEALTRQGLEVAHFKMSLQAEPGAGLAVVNQVISGDPPQLSRRLEQPLQAGTLLINLRAEGEADKLQTLIRDVLSGCNGPQLEWGEESFFQPGEPKPTHRLGALSH